MKNKKSFSAITKMLFIFLSGMVISLTSRAGEFQVKGRLSVEKLDAFSHMLETTPPPHKLVLDSSFGFDQRDTRSLVRWQKLVMANKVTTEVNGWCVAECAYLFLSGKERYLLETNSKKKTTLVLHPFVNEDNEYIDEFVDEIQAIVIQQSSGKIDQSFFENLNHVHDSKGGIAIFREPQLNGAQILLRTSYHEKPRTLPQTKLEDLGIGIR